MTLGNINEDGDRNNNGSTEPRPACASCKHQRKKCGKNCILAPYFQAERNREFQAVHRLFGVSNVTKLVRSVGEEDRKLLMDSLIWEALCRQNDPVLGCLGEYRKLAEELKFYKSRMENQAPSQNLNQNKKVQFNEQMYKSPAGIIPWNSPNAANYGTHNNGFGIGGVLNFDHENNAYIPLHAIPICCPSQNYARGQERGRKENNAAAFAPLQRQPQVRHHSVNGFNQNQYYHSGN